MTERVLESVKTMAEGAKWTFSQFGPAVLHCIYRELSISRLAEGYMKVTSKKLFEVVFVV